jgi:hypothetical protein
MKRTLQQVKYINGATLAEVEDAVNAFMVNNRKQNWMIEGPIGCFDKAETVGDLVFIQTLYRWVDCDTDGNPLV